MVKLATASFVVFVYAAMVVSGRPFLSARVPDNLPSGTAMFAIDDATGKIIAFDSSQKKIGEVAPPPNAPAPAPQRRDGATGSCGQLSKDDIKKLPGWDKLEQKAKDNWGDGSYNLDANPDDYTDMPANLCLQSDAVNLAPDAKPSCQTAAQSSDGQTVGANLTATLSFTSGTSYKATTTVTKQSSIGTGLKVGGKATIPGFEVSVERSLDLTWTNTQSHAEETTDNAQTTSTIAQSGKAGQECHLDFNTTSCNLEGSGKVAYVATGWAWFNYNDKTHDHYKWALNMDDVLSQDERSSFMEFKSAISTSTNSKYNSVCKDV